MGPTFCVRSSRGRSKSAKFDVESQNWFCGFKFRSSCDPNLLPCLATRNIPNGFESNAKICQVFRHKARRSFGYSTLIHNNQTESSNTPVHSNCTWSSSSLNKSDCSWEVNTWKHPHLVPAESETALRRETWYFSLRLKRLETRATSSV